MDVAELRRWVDTRELMRRDRENHRLKLDRLNELPSTVMKQASPTFYVGSFTGRIEEEKVSDCTTCTGLARKCIKDFVQTMNISSAH